MTSTQKFFRTLWRLNAVVIFLAATAITLVAGSMLWPNFGGSSQGGADAAPQVVNDDSSERLYLGSVSQVAGTNTLRGALLAPGRGGKGFGSSSGYGSETRNLLFIDGQTKAARWLLPDRQHIVATELDITTTDAGSHSLRTIATVALVKPVSSDVESASGSLLLLDPSGRQVHTVTEGVREIDHADVNAEGRIVVLFERNRKYVMAVFDGASLERVSEDELSVPQLP